MGTPHSILTSLIMNELLKNRSKISAVILNFLANFFRKKLAISKITIHDSGMNKKLRIFERMKNMFKLKSNVERYKVGAV